ncbi:CPBP family intramembrane glutamic endopeptidase [Nocardiopsis sp. B62]|uniref:CPBP family intramembrane glutamic endopeptidase n=1 Tax=Nocardiopsis sp. B62 TaxID=2824874 RepID=UPI001B3707CD|nr:CPBP family intramembrane glutamic endopeptidase [Nocardiopsis sp. B62]MBQ1083914.1 CPBP family intramembrane metalloprotease [Nocardiopsis sp. B62]
MSPDLTAPVFSPAALVVAALVFAYLLLVEPLWGRRMFEVLKRDRDTDPGLYVRFFGTGMAVFWGMTGLTALTVLLSPGAEWAHLGLHGDVDWGTVAGMFVGFAVAAVMVTLLARWKAMPVSPTLDPMLPRTTRERWCAVGASVTAGVCEEIIFRGLLIAVGVSLGLPLYVAAGAALVVFTLAHLYQGAKDMLLVGLLGCALTYLYLSTGSLIVPILVHVLVDLRALLLTPRPATGRSGQFTPAA